jgi:GNAT superfamily N-acetyltransferase
MFSPLEVLNLGWVKNAQNRAALIPFSAYRALECRTKAEDLIVTLLVRAAKNEDSGFLYGSSENSHALLCIDNRQYLGYIRWSHGKERHPALRQLFVVPERRREGIATALIRYWAETYAFPVGEKFGVENPNEKTIRILTRLGFGKQCYSVLSI